MVRLMFTMFSILGSSGPSGSFELPCTGDLQLLPSGSRQLKVIKIVYTAGPRDGCIQWIGQHLVLLSNYEVVYAELLEFGVECVNVRQVED
ncbi:hypothetical protein BpHYR1_023146 [Brachionus plicatilis]|uniref:Uncharacterized protein n=1 Tax=Brachionus plicatilis TaxID=10195 RepID=A0A3M7S9J9_BRAPC|nr:hypothetical protein BpHYR1_023146 [Brachionus plicatilis]